MNKRMIKISRFYDTSQNINTCIFSKNKYLDFFSSTLNYEAETAIWSDEGNLIFRKTRF